MARVDGRQHDRLQAEPVHAEPGEHEEPQHHHRTEQAPDAVRPLLLDGKHANQNDHRDRHHVRFDHRRGDLQPFDGAEHRNGRRDHAVAVEERGAEEPQQHQHRPLRHVAGTGRQQRGERQDATFAVVIGAHHDGDVLHRDHEDQRVDDEREHAEDVFGRGGDAVRPVEALAQGVERAGADVAIDDADSADGKRKQSLVRRPCGHEHSSNEPTGLADGLEVGCPLPE